MHCAGNHRIVSRWQSPTHISLKPYAHLSERSHHSNFYCYPFINVCTIKNCHQGVSSSHCSEILIKNTLLGEAYRHAILHKFNKEVSIPLR